MPVNENRVLRTKIALLYKTYAQWDLVKNTYVPVKGEVCLCAIPAGTGVAQTEPAVLFKVGDGTTVFEQLPWATALAGDVYAWAKKANLEFGDLNAAFLAELDNRIISRSENAEYQMVGANGVWKLQKRDVDTQEWIDVSTVDVAGYVQPLIAAEKARAEAEEAKKINLLGNVDDPTDPGYGWPYHFPYDASFTADANKITIGLKTITLDNNKSKLSFDRDLPSATAVTAGLMSAADKVKLENKADLPLELPAELKVEGVDYPWFMVNMAPTGIDANGNVHLDHSGYNFNSKQYYTWRDKVIPMAATATTGGLMTAADKVRLDNTAALPPQLPDELKVEGVDYPWFMVNMTPTGIDANGNVHLNHSGYNFNSKQYYTWRDQIIPMAATTTTGGLLTAADKVRLDNTASKTELTVEEGARILADEALDKNKLNVLPKVDDPTDPGFGWEYHIPYSFDATPDADKLNITLKTLTLDNKLTKMNFSKALVGATSTTAGLLTATDKVRLDGTASKAELTTEASIRSTTDAALERNKLNVLPLVDDPTDPGFGWEYHIPYSFEATPDAEKLNIKLKTLTLDNKVTKMNFDKALPGATTTTAGLMTAADKVALGGKQDRLTAGENITIVDNVINAIVEECTIGRTFTTNMNVGNLPAGTQINATDKLADILYKILHCEGNAFFFESTTYPITSTSQAKESQDITAEIVDTGLVHYFNPSVKSYLGFAYPKSYGPLLHVYQNDLVMFDLISDMVRSEITHNGTIYYLYQFNELSATGEDKYEFLWK